MRGPTILLLAAALAAGQPATRQQKIERILELTHADAVVDTVVAQVRGMLEQLQANPTPQQKNRREEALEKIAKLARERMRKVRPELVKAYAEEFTDAELDGLLAFYETPAGRALIEKTPAINSRLSAIIQAEMNAIGAEINKLAEDTLKR
jgi:hypothetical protein